MLTGFLPFPGVEDLKEYLKTNEIQMKHGISQTSISLLKCLLCKDPESRLGSHEGISEFKEHPFFSFIEWDRLVENRNQTMYEIIERKNVRKESTDSTNNNIAV